MKIGMVGLGKMGGQMAHRLADRGFEVWGYAQDPDREQMARWGVRVAESLEEIVERLAGDAPRVVWVMVPSGPPTEATVNELADLLGKGDVIVDGGNSKFKDTIERAARIEAKGISYVDSGTSGGVWGYDVGYCQMVGGTDEAVAIVAPAVTALAPEKGWLHTGPSGAGHFVKMIHNGIEYGMMQAYAEGFEILENSRFDLDLPAISKLWQEGSVVRSWLLDLIARAYEDDPKMEKITGWVDDSGEGRWTVDEAIETATPAPVLALSLMMRFRSRQADSYAGKLLSAMRNQFGGHATKAAVK